MHRANIPGRIANQHIINFLHTVEGRLQRNRREGGTTMHIHVPASFERLALMPSGSYETDLHFNHVGSYVVFDLDGPLAMPWVADELRDDIQQMLEGGRKNLIIDLADVPYADSAGVGALVAARIMIREAGGKLVLVAAGRRVVEMLKRMRLDGLFTFRPDRNFESHHTRS
jgi:anti-sigma B factor antagonist